MDSKRQYQLDEYFRTLMGRGVERSDEYMFIAYYIARTQRKKRTIPSIIAKNFGFKNFIQFYRYCFDNVENIRSSYLLAYDNEEKAFSSFYNSIGGTVQEYWSRLPKPEGITSDLDNWNHQHSAVHNIWESKSNESLYNELIRVFEHLGKETDATADNTQLPSTEVMQFPPEVAQIQTELDEEKEEENEQIAPQEDLDQRGWVYVLWSPAYPTWVVTGKGKSITRPGAYNTYSPHRDFQLVGIAYTENRKESEKQLQDEIDETHQNTRGAPAPNGAKSEWFEITRQQAYEILSRLNPRHTYTSIFEDE